tara:strand:- start:231 stop:1706 length:1476 start_codon:yes stop_codon:yes gene_type:complete
MNNKNNVRVRFAPSPTGDPHLGAMRTALFNWAFAKKNNGVFILRIEDTDKKRQVKGSVENIIEGMKWLGLDYDEGPEVGGDYGPYIQSERNVIYKKAVNKLLDEGKAYMCDLTSDELSKMKEIQVSQGKAPGYNGHSRNRSREELEQSKKDGVPVVVRLKVPMSGQIEFKDAKRGIMKFDLSKIDDFVILKADGLPTYHLANVIDDSAMKISHVLRGEEWISSTPKHLLIYQFLDLNPPDYVHLPLIFGKDKSKLSKRHGAKSIIEYKEGGLLPSALANYISLLGWSPKNNEEIMSYDELINKFDFEGLSVSPSIFDTEKLEWINGVHIRNSNDSELLNIIYDYLLINLVDSESDLINKATLKNIIPLIKERIKSFEDLYPLIKFFFNYMEPDMSMLTCGNKNQKEVSEILTTTEFVLKNLSADNLTSSKDIEQALRGLSVKFDLKIRDYLGLIRNTITGSKVSPPLFESIEILGITESIKRINSCNNKLS